MKEQGGEITLLLTLTKESFNLGLFSLTEREALDIVVSPLFL